MEFESEDQIPQNIPSISGVSQELDDTSTESRENDIKKISPRNDTDSVSDKNADQSDEMVANGVTTLETKTGSEQKGLQLTSNIMTEGVLAEIDEPITKAMNLNSNLLSSELPAMKVRQSPLQRNSASNERSDEECNHITKEEVKIQDLANVIVSDDTTHGRSKNCEALEETRGCVNKERPECSPDYSQVDCKTQIPSCERQEVFNVAVPKTVTSAKAVTVQEEVCEALDLSLPKKKAKDNKEKCKWVLDSGYEGSLLMEVDEIEDDTHYVEVEQDEDDVECWFPLRNDMNNFHSENWDQQSLSNIAISSPPCISDLSHDPKDTLLIDDQGIPYTLTSDGHKVPQIDSPEMPKDTSEQISPGFAQFEDNNEMALPGQDSDPAQEFLPNLPLGDSSPGLSTETSEDISAVEKTSTHDTAFEATSTALPAISSLPPLPIQIVASNTGSNTPILLLPQSQLQTLSTSNNSNPGVMALSLPLALAQNSQSSPVFLVLASPQVSCGIKSSTFSGQLSEISSTSSLTLPVVSGSHGLKLEPVSCTTTTTNLSGQKKPCNFTSAPTSPTTSSSTSSATSRSPNKQLKSDACSDTPTSFQEALLRLAVSAVQKSENQTKSIEMHSVITTSSCTEETQTRSPSTTHAPEKDKTEQVLSPISEPDSMLGDQTDTLLSPASENPPSSSSPLRPGSPIFPTNHPKNQDSQALGPRRILYCQYCPRVFYYLSDLERHSITHSQSKPHVCQLCGKAFKRSSHLERHKHIHTGQRNFMCQLCPRRFREAAELTRHQRVHTGEKPFQCLLCHMRFAERNTLRRHTKRKHQGQQQEAMNVKVKPETAGVSLLGIQGQQEENAEWYSSTMTEMDSDNDTGGE